MPPLAFARLAATAGLSGVTLFAAQLAINPYGFAEWSLVRDRALRRDLRGLLDDLGLDLMLGEGCMVAPDREATACAPIIETFAELGAKRLNLISYEPDPARDFDQTCRIAELAGAAGLAVSLEFSARPGRPTWPEFITRIVSAGLPNLSALIDAMHFCAAGGAPADLAAVPPALVGHLQLCDAHGHALDPSGEAYAAAALHERLVPGEGTLPLAALVAALPPGVPVTLEIPQVARSLAGEPQVERLRRAAARSRSLLGALV